MQHAKLIRKEINMNNYFVHESSYVAENAQVLSGTKIWHFCHIQNKATIGQQCTLGQNVYIGSNVTIGNYCKIQNNVSIYEGVTLEDYVFCGPSCVFTNDLTPRSKYPKNNLPRINTLIKHGASIGANATIVCGHTIGRHAMVGAGAVVTSDVPDYALMLGVPARQMGWVCECGSRLTDHLLCNQCNYVYKLNKGRLTCETNDH